MCWEGWRERGTWGWDTGMRACRTGAITQVESKIQPTSFEAARSADGTPFSAPAAGRSLLLNALRVFIQTQKPVQLSLLCISTLPTGLAAPKSVPKHGKITRHTKRPAAGLSLSAGGGSAKRSEPGHPARGKVATICDTVSLKTRVCTQPGRHGNLKCRAVQTEDTRALGAVQRDGQANEKALKGCNIGL